MMTTPTMQDLFRRDADLQACGGMHVANTAEIGGSHVTKIEKKSATTRRAMLGFSI